MCKKYFATCTKTFNRNTKRAVRIRDRKQTPLTIPNPMINLSSTEKPRTEERNIEQLK